MEDTINANIQRPSLLSDTSSLGLYNLTGWTGTFFNYWKSNVGSNNMWVLSWYGNVETREAKERIPAYDFMYLLDKAPKSFTHKDKEYHINIDVDATGTKWQVDYRTDNDGQYIAEVSDSLVEALGLVLGTLVTDNIIPNGKA